jgi:hypothetical protein
MAQEAIASTEIEIGPFDKDKRTAMLIYMMGNGDISMKEALVMVDYMKQFEPVDNRPFDTYLNGMTIEEKIMGAAQEVINNFETTYDKKSYAYDSSGYWKEVNSCYVYQSSTPAYPFMLGQ